MRQQTIGMELEFTGLTRQTAAQVVANVFGTTARTGGRGWQASDDEGRTWNVVPDSSIRANGGEQCELVSPILRWGDIETVQRIVRELRAAGAKVNDSCGLHVHIGAAGMTAKAVRNLVNNFASHEALLIKALDVHAKRKRYCKPLNREFLNRLNARKPTTLAELGEVWYNLPEADFPTYHYHESRYTTLNLHALFTKGTVEFRIFNSTLHAGEVKTALQLACALVANAKGAKKTIYRLVQTENERFAMRTWLTRPQGLNLNGEEFSTLRYHLTKRLDGNAAWRFAV
ncbi:MAG: amidoligase family protein [Selenomonadaceae bacterium]|nr:amidoligase family protein [Selenomonadaceae bacterium]MBQ3434356.1 amidoligase family protein [Selenomonadaceae bacterium]